MVDDLLRHRCFALGLFCSRHRRAILAGAIALLVLTAFVAGWSLTPKLLADEIAERMEDRLGALFELADVSFGTDHVVLSDLATSSPEGDVELTIEEMRIDGDLIALAQREAGSIRSIRVEGAHLVVDLDHPAAEGRIDTWRRLVAAEGEDTGGAVEAAADEAGLGPLDTLVRLLRDGGEVEVADAALTVVERGETMRVLRAVDSRAIRRSSRAFELAGDGRHGSGRLEWRLRADLGAPELEGDLGWSELPLELALRRLEELPVVAPAAARTSGWARVRLDGGRRAAVTGRAEVVGLSLRSSVLAEVPIEDLSGAAEGSAVVDLAERRLVIEEARIERRGAAGRLAGEVSWPEDSLRLRLEAALPRSACDAVVGAVPAEILGELAGFELSGELEARLSLELDTASPDATELEIEVDDGCRFERVPALADLERFRGPFHHVVRGAGGELVHAFETGPGTPAWTPIEEVSPFFLQAVLAHEDAGYFRHAGFAVYAMESALERNLEEGRFALGASTLTMQLAKNLFLSRDKTLSRKAREALLTWWLEHALDKREILELYVNVIEYGPEVFGIRHAAAHYFGRHPLDLTPAESVYLATLLPAPIPRSRQYEEGALWPGTESEIRFLLRHMARKGRIDGVALAHGLRQLEGFEFHYGDRMRTAEVGLGEPGELPFATRYVPRAERWWSRLAGGGLRTVAGERL